MTGTGWRQWIGDALPGVPVVATLPDAAFAMQGQLSPGEVVQRMLGAFPPAVWAIALLVFLLSMLRRSGGGLEAVYPAVTPAPGTKRTRERVVFGKRFVMNWVKIGADHAYLHVSVTSGFRSNATFSIPLADITAEPDRYPAMILDPDVVKLTFARDRALPMLVWPRVFARLSEASRGRLRLASPTE